MQFRTRIPIDNSQKPIDYSSEILLLGSCFAENIGTKFDYFKFKNGINPFGIIFNPVSIENLINRAVNNKKFTESDIFFHNDLWHSYEIHSALSNPNKEALLNQLNELIHQTNAQISKLTHFQITYGTAWVYRNRDTNQIVANCHKVPQKQFKKELLSIETIQNSIQNTIKLVEKINPKCQFIFTISPVRHLKDGFVENSLSKAHLISALQQTISNKQQTVNYFPSYEIMMDELRDYRFYEEDMLHPTKTAIDYIWQRFSENYITQLAFQTMSEVDSIQKSLLHKPFNPDSKSHQKFLLQLNLKIKNIKTQLPEINF